MAISLFGAHGTGKTTLARAYAGKHGVQFVETSVTALFREMGIDSANPPRRFGLRLAAQRQLLHRLDAMYCQYSGQQTIFDRCPLDLLGYTLAEVHPNVVAPEDQEQLAIYVQACYDVLNKHFGVVLLIQPGIPLEERAGRGAGGALDKAYIEHLNMLMLGASCDERVKVPHFYLPREVLDLSERIDRLENVVGRAEYATLQGSISHRASGALFH